MNCFDSTLRPIICPSPSIKMSQIPQSSFLPTFQFQMPCPRAAKSRLFKEYGEMSHPFIYFPNHAGNWNCQSSGHETITLTLPWCHNTQPIHPKILFITGLIEPFKAQISILCPAWGCRQIKAHYYACHVKSVLEHRFGLKRPSLMKVINSKGDVWSDIHRQ